MNEDTPTRLPTNGPNSSPDISLACISLLPYAHWETRTNLGSDHLPIVIKLETDLKPTISENRTFINFKKANWEEFQQTTEEEFSKIEAPTDIYKGEQIFRNIINKAAKTSIPAGRIKSIYPEIPTEAVNKMKERDQLRNEDPQSIRIQDINKEIDKIINTHKREKWRESIEDKKADTNKLYKLMKFLNGGTKSNQNEAIKFKGKYISKPKSIADKFNQQYSSVIKHVSSKTARTNTKDSKKKKLAEDEFTETQVTEAIKKAKASKALGPDKISNLHLKHIGPLGIKYLTNLFNISIQTSSIPAIWKTSTIIPLLKPGKPSDDSTSYRPVSLLCPSIKILERLILPTLNENLDIPQFQHGFRAQHSTVSALHDFTESIAAGFNKKKPADRTLLVQIDLSKAFDMVSHEKLLLDLNNSNLPKGIIRWYNCYLHGRQSRVNFRNTTSSTRNVRTGVPQGAVTSPILFNFYLRNIPQPPPGIKVIQYADDISIYIQGTNVITLSSTVNKYLNTLAAYLEERNLIISPEKSTATWFTPASAEANTEPEISIKGKSVKLDKNPKLLGITFDTMFCFGPHIRNTISKAKKKMNILKSLAGSSWGCDKEVILLIYKSIVRSVLEYGSQIWSPILKPTHWKNLQIIQNQAMRIATGCLTMSAINHLHNETLLLPVKIHCDMKNKQYAVACHLPNHPGGKNFNNNKPPRIMKRTISTEHKETTDRLIGTTNLERTQYKKIIKEIHTDTVESTISTYSPNKVLNCPALPINKTEKNLPRSARTELARLRSGYSRRLNSYLNRLDPEIQNQCPDCHISPHDTCHIFNCLSKPTNLTVTDLWFRPVEVAEYLKLIEDPGD